MYYIYILRCSDSSLYVGYTTNVEARVRAHSMGLGAAHTYKRLPVELVHSESHATRLAAVRRERQLKGWSREKKEALIRGDFAVCAYSAIDEPDAASNATSNPVPVMRLTTGMFRVERPLTYCDRSGQAKW